MKTIERRVKKERRDTERRAGARRSINKKKEKVFSNGVTIHIGFRHSFKRAFAGLKLAWTTERNFKIEVILGLITLIGASFVGLSLIEWVILSGIITFVLVMELLNTVIELFIDLVVRKEYKIKARRAKDVSATVVLVSAIGAFISGLLLLINHFI